MKNVFITGCCGFIGSNAFEYFAKKYKDCNIIGYDNLTYCGKLSNIESALDRYKNAKFIKGDICDKGVYDILVEHNIDTIINFAAESHVDNSLANPYVFAETNVIGTLNLLECARKAWNKNTSDKLFFHISTDEVFGSLKNETEEKFKESNVYAPNSPYSASKASSDYFVRAYSVSFNIPTIITHCSNNYGPKQHKEKLIPTVISCLMNNKNIPVYGTGMNIRDWIFVDDHIDAIDLLINEGTRKSTYNIGGNHEETNVSIINKIIEVYAYYTTKGSQDDINKRIEELKKLVTFVPDRLGHDFRYAIDTGKMNFSYGWKPQTKFDEGLKKTVKWYLENKDFLS